MSSKLEGHASDELHSLSLPEIRWVMGWWERWTREVGSRLLGRLLVGIPVQSPPKGAQAFAHAKAELDAAQAGRMQAWWKRWYAELGYRRLARIVREHSNPTSSECSPVEGTVNGSRGAGPQSRAVVSQRPIRAYPELVIAAAGRDGPEAFHVRVRGGAVELLLNENHSAFANLVDLLNDEDHGALAAALLGSWALLESEMPVGPLRERLGEIRVDWGRHFRSVIANAGSGSNDSD